MLSLIRRMFCPRCFSWGTGNFCEECDTRTPIERWSERNANICSPEQLIQAHVINSIAKDFDDWKLVTKNHHLSASLAIWTKACEEISKRHPNVDVGWCNRLLHNRSRLRNVKGITILYRTTDAANNSSFYVNGVSFDGELGTQIVKAFNEIKEKRREAEAVAAKVLKEHKANEERWNLAEELLGMKRNEHGALVPVKTVEA